MKASILLIVLLASCVYASKLQLQYGTYIARSNYGTGSFDLRCYGGSGSYEFSYNKLPQGWRSQGRTIIIPNIGALFGRSYLINVEIKDKVTNDILNGNIVLVVNGVRIDVGSAGLNSLVFIDGSSASINSRISNSNSSSSFTSTNTVQNTASSTSTSSSTRRSSQIESLYNSYPGLPISTNTISIPTNIGSNPVGAPRTPNPGPQIIANAQATYVPSRDANTITIDQVKRNAIFNRQINANKAIANLITIITRLTANVNAAKNDIITLRQLLQNSRNQNDQCNEQVYSFANTRAKIQNAIADKQNALLIANANIEQVKNSVKQLQRQLVSLNSQRNIIQVRRSPNSSKLKSLQNDLNDCERKKSSEQGELRVINSKISSLQNDVQQIQQDASNAPLKILQINRQQPIVDRKIADLKRKLADAQQEKSQLGRDRKMYQNQIEQAQLKVKRLQREIAREKTKIPTIQSNIQSIQRNCLRIRNQINQLRGDLASIQSNYSILLEQINAQQSLVNSKKSELQILQNSIKDLPEEIRLLRAELSKVDASLRRQYFICQSTADDVRAAQQNLEAMRIKLERESQFLVQANANLQKARAQKQLADIAVQQVIQTYTDALPFAIIPNGNGLTYSGQPAGNNPSGSPLGPVSTGSPSTYQYDSVSIGDLNTYLSRAYRAGVDPARPDTVTSLYPLSTVTLNTLVNQSRAGLVNYNPSYSAPSGNLYNFQCGTQGTMITGSGTIYSVQPGMIQINTNSGLTNLRLSGCTNLESIRQNQILSSRDSIYFRGSRAGGNNINLDSLTCV